MPTLAPSWVPPRYAVFGVVGSMPSAFAATGSGSPLFTGAQVEPPSTLLNIPSEPSPVYTMLGWAGSTARLSVEPPVEGPCDVQLPPDGPATAGDDAKGTEARRSSAGNT